MKEKLKGILIGILIGLIGAGTIACAQSIKIQKTLNYNNIRIFLDGKQINPKDANGNTVEPFIIDGTTYLPVRAIGEAFGKEVSWDGNTNTVYIGAKPEQKHISAYAEDIKAVINQYGRYVNSEGMGIKGLKYGDLVDFERDGVPELVLLHDMNVEVYRFDGEKSSLIYEEKTGSRHGQTDVSYTFVINKNRTEPCLITYQSMDEWYVETLHILTLKDGQSTVKILYADGKVPGAGENGPASLVHFKIGDANVSESEYKKMRNNYFDGGREIDVNWAEGYFDRENYIQATKDELDEFLIQFGL